jgi:hypothetical protein
MALTNAQIIALACADAKVPGYATTQAGPIYNAILEELARDYDTAASRKFTTITLGANFGPFNLPADYLRCCEQGLWFTINGAPYFPVSADLAEFDMEPQTVGLDGYPTIFATDMALSPPGLYVWPGKSGLVISLRYQALMPDIVSPEASAVTPWFPNSNYLRTRLAGELMKLTDDVRYQQFLGDGDGPAPAGSAAAILKRYLTMEGDRINRTHTVSLDRRRFGQSNAQLPNTKQIGW